MGMQNVMRVIAVLGTNLAHIMLSADFPDKTNRLQTGREVSNDITSVGFQISKGVRVKPRYWCVLHCASSKSL